MKSLLFGTTIPSYYLQKLLEVVEILMLNADCFLTSLSARVSHLILEVTLKLPVRDFLFAQGFEIRKEQITRWWTVDKSAPRFTQTPNSSESKSDETMQSLSKTFALY